MSVSVLIPAFNEEANIASCIEGVKWADEIVVADSFSTDKTREIALLIPKTRVIQRKYNYSASQKNWAIPQLKGEWILILDADERVTPGLCKEIREIVNRPFKEGDPVAYWIRRKSFYLGKEIKFCGWQNDKVIRLFKKGKAVYEDKFVHAEMIVEGPVGILKNYLKHYTVTSISQHLAKILKYTTWKAAERARKGRKTSAFDILLRTFFKFFRDYILKLGILDGTRGVVVCGFSAFSEFITGCKLWEINRLNE